MPAINLDPGACLGFGGTNARMAACAGGDVLDFTSVKTPKKPDLFFEWMARSLLDASHDGAYWLVAGFPGPVSADGNIVGPLVNVSGMRKKEYDLRAQLTAADPEVGRVLDEGFALLAVNDGTLAAQAAAAHVGEHAFSKTGALIFGTGVGSGVVEKDPDYRDVHRADTKNPNEIGHLLLGSDPFDTFEYRYSGPGIKRRYGQEAEDLPAEHPAWEEQGIATGRLATTLGLMTGVELVVPTGGVGAGASAKYGPHLDSFIKAYRYGNSAQRKFIPEIRLVPPGESAEFEMYGAEGVMRDHVTAGADIADFAWRSPQFDHE